MSLVSSYDLGAEPVEPGTDLSSLPYFAVLENNYTRCDTGEPLFGTSGNPWEFYVKQYVGWWDYTPGDGYDSRFFRVAVHSELGPVVLAFHYQGGGPDTSDWPQISVSDWDYTRCDNGQPLFGASWEHEGPWYADYDELDVVGEVYEHRYAEFYGHAILGDIIVVHHFDNSGSYDGHICTDSAQIVIDNPAFPESVCASSPVYIPDDPWATGRLSSPQSVELSEAESIWYHRLNDTVSHGLWMSEDGTYIEAVHVQTWLDIMAGIGSAISGSTGAFKDHLPYGTVSYWETSAVKTGGAFQSDFFTQHQARMDGRAWRSRISDTMPTNINSLVAATGEFGEDWAFFPGTHLTTRERYRWTGYPELKAAGLKFSIQPFASLNHAFTDNYQFPIPVKARFEWDDDAYPLEAFSDQSEGRTPIRPGSGLTFDLNFTLVEGMGPGVSEWPATFDGAEGDIIIRSSEVNANDHWEFVIEHPGYTALLNENRLTPYEYTYPTVLFYIDPQFWSGTIPPFGGFGVSFFDQQQHRVRANIGNNFMLWQEVQWPPWVYWIPDDLPCPPHLRLIQRSDPAKGPFENIPVTPECGKALRLMGRDVHQNLIPGKGPRVQPNSYP